MSERNGTYVTCSCVCVCVRVCVCVCVCSRTARQKANIHPEYIYVYHAHEWICTHRYGNTQNLLIHIYTVLMHTHCIHVHRAHLQICIHEIWKNAKSPDQNFYCSRQRIDCVVIHIVGSDYHIYITSAWPYVTFKRIELPAKLLDYFLRSNKSNINQYSAHTYTFVHTNICTHKKISRTRVLTAHCGPEQPWQCTTPHRLC